MRRHDLKPARVEILWWEICCLLHDIGKLSDEFLYYRQRWHLMKNGWEKKDPHDHDWLGKDGILPDFPSVETFVKRPILIDNQVPGSLSIANAVQNHMQEAGDDLIRLLQLGDKTDTRDDRNNPLIGCEQTCHRDPSQIPARIFRSNVFGFEGERTQVNVAPATGPLDDPVFSRPGVLGRARHELYRRLEQQLVGRPVEIQWERYDCLRRNLKRYFEPAMSDTTRPGNDTSLWEHVYSVASIAKAVHARLLLTGKPSGVADVDKLRLFRIWGMGFDGLRFLSHSHKIGDILGRRDVIQSLFAKVRRELVFETPVANDIYQDDNCILFLTTNVGEEGFYASLDEEFEKEAARHSKGELQPCFTLSDPTSALTIVVKCLEDLRRKSAVPFHAPTVHIRDQFLANWRGRNASVCAVCRMRPARRFETQEKVCEECKDRRKNRLPDFVQQETKHQTPFINEIAGSSRRAALIVARFGLEDWLNGKLVRTNLITQADAIRKTLKAYLEIKDLKGSLGGQESWIHSRLGDPSFQRIREEFAALQTEHPGEHVHAAPIYGRPFGYRPFRWNNGLSEAQEDWRFLLDAAAAEGTFPASDLEKHLVNVVCAKSPTPSTILDIWETTSEFLENITRPTEGFDSGEDVAGVFRSFAPRLAEMLPARGRVWVRLEETVPFDSHETATLQLGGRNYEVVYEDSNHLLWILRETPDDATRARWSRGRLVHDDDESPVTVSASGLQENAYVPFREISCSPEMLLLLVPADKAIDITVEIYRSYYRELGKAWGRLPFSIGLIFFPEHLPMFSVLDAARRMERNFDWLQRKVPWQKLKMPLPAQLGLKLGDGTPDWHHPYVFTETHKPSRFETLMGPVARLEELGPDDEIRIRPNYFDYEWLGASAARFHLHLPRTPVTETCLAQGGLGAVLRRTGGAGQGPRLLDQLETEIAGLWRHLKTTREISDSRLRNLDHLILSRRHSWRTSEDPAAADSLNDLAGTLIRYYFPESHERVLAAFNNGFFDRTLDLYVRILKDRLELGAPNA